MWGPAACEVLVGNLFILVALIDDQRVTYVKRMYKCFQSSVHFNFPGVSCIVISTWTFFILWQITSDTIIPRFLRWVRYSTYLFSSSYPTSPGCPPLNQMKLSTGSLLFLPHKALAAATAHRKHWLLALQLPRTCWWLWNLYFFAKGPNPHIKLHMINIPILVVHKFLKLKISKTRVLIPTSFPWKIAPSISLIIIYVATHPKTHWDLLLYTTHTHQILAHWTLSLLLLKLLSNLASP